MKAPLLARREYFGYLFYNTSSGELFIAKTEDDLDFSDEFEIYDKSSRSTYKSSEVKLLQSNVTRSDILSAPTYVEIYPTLFCNERCEFCYVGDKLNNYLKGMERKDAIKISDDLVANGIFEVSILGGEPFLYKDLSWLLDLLHEKGFDLSISTNGTIYNKDVLDRILRYDADLNFSFHSHIPSIHADIVKNPSALEKTIATLRSVIKDGHSPHVSFLINKKNADTILETVEFLCSEGVKRISIFHAMKSGFALDKNEKNIDFIAYKNLFLKAVEIGKRYNVEVTSRTNFPFLIYKDMVFDTSSDYSNLIYGTVDSRRVLYIMYDGSTYSTLYKLQNNQAYLGNILAEGLHSLWANNENLDRLRTTTLPKPCFKCKHIEYCRGGSVINYGSLNRQPECPLYVTSLLTE